MTRLGLPVGVGRAATNRVKGKFPDKSIVKCNKERAEKKEFWMKQLSNVSKVIRYGVGFLSLHSVMVLDFLSYFTQSDAQRTNSP